MGLDANAGLRLITNFAKRVKLYLITVPSCEFISPFLHSLTSSGESTFKLWDLW